MPRLWHFTSRVHYHYIRSEGLTRGECPVSRDVRLDFPNLTDDPLPQAQGWAVPDPSFMAVNKQAVRIAVDVPGGDDRLVAWRSLAERHGMDRRSYRRLDAAGGFGAKHWWIYRGVIPPAWFAGLELYPFDESAWPIERALLALAPGYPTFDGLMDAAGFRPDPRDGSVMIDAAGLRRLLAAVG
jgi:hypothetical protein